MPVVEASLMCGVMLCNVHRLLIPDFGHLVTYLMVFFLCLDTGFVQRRHGCKHQEPMHAMHMLTYDFGLFQRRNKKLITIYYSFLGVGLKLLYEY